MQLTPQEHRFLTALVREQNQKGCRGPAHQLLRERAYPDVPTVGRGALRFSYDAIPLTSLLLKDFSDLQQIDDFLRRGAPVDDVVWPWSSAEEYHARLAEARREVAHGDNRSKCPASVQ